MNDLVHQCQSLLPVGSGRMSIERRMGIDLLLAQPPHQFDHPLAELDGEGTDGLADPARMQFLAFDDELAGDCNADRAADVADG